MNLIQGSGESTSSPMANLIVDDKTSFESSSLENPESPQNNQIDSQPTLDVTQPVINRHAILQQQQQQYRNFRYTGNTMLKKQRSFSADVALMRMNSPTIDHLPSSSSSSTCSSSSTTSISSIELIKNKAQADDEADAAGTEGGDEEEEDENESYLSCAEEIIKNSRNNSSNNLNNNNNNENIKIVTSVTSGKNMNMAMKTYDEMIFKNGGVIDFRYEENSQENEANLIKLNAGVNLNSTANTTSTTLNNNQSNLNRTCPATVGGCYDVDKVRERLKTFTVAIFVDSFDGYSSNNSSDKSLSSISSSSSIASNCSTIQPPTKSRLSVVENNT